jgi:hypothetical protein
MGMIASHICVCATQIVISPFSITTVHCYSDLDLQAVKQQSFHAKVKNKTIINLSRLVITKGSGS